MVLELATALVAWGLIFIGVVSFAITAFGGGIIFQLGWHICSIYSESTCGINLTQTLSIISLMGLIKFPIQVAHLWNHVNYQIALRLSIYQCMGTFFGLYILIKFGTSVWLKRAFGVLITLLAVWYMRKEMQLISTTGQHLSANNNSLNDEYDVVNSFDSDISEREDSIDPRGCVDSDNPVTDRNDSDPYPRSSINNNGNNGINSSKTVSILNSAALNANRLHDSIHNLVDKIQYTSAALPINERLIHDPEKHTQYPLGLTCDDIADLTVESSTPLDSPVSMNYAAFRIPSTWNKGGYSIQLGGAKLELLILLSGLTSGVLDGIYGTGGLPLLFFVFLSKIDKDVWRGTVSVAYFFENLVKAVYLFYVREVISLKEEYILEAGIIIAVLFGLFCGNILAKRVDTVLWRKVMLVILMGGSALMITSGLHDFTSVLILSGLLISYLAFFMLFRLQP